MELAVVRAAPAQFSANPHRRSMIAKIHVQKKELALDEDDYRQILLEETGRSSAADCTEAEMERVLRRFAALGAKSPQKLPANRPAQHKVARKARALWISLHHLGAVESPSEKALESFAKRQLKCERLVWANQSQGYRLIEALKAMAVRHGWPQTDARGAALSTRELHEGLCRAILWKLKCADAIPADWTINTAAWRLCGIDVREQAPMGAEAYQSLAQALGRKLREAGGVK